VLVYICLASGLLYLECVSYSTEGVKKATSNRELFAEPRTLGKIRRKSTAGSAILAVCSLPIFAIIVFLSIPRIESLVDHIAALIYSVMNPMNVTLTLPSGYLGTGGGNDSGASSAVGSGAFGGKTGGEFKGPHQLKEDSSASSQKEVKLPASFTPSKKEEPKLREQPPEEQSPLPSTMNLADAKTEEEMTLMYGGGKAAIGGQDKVLFTVNCPREVYLRRLCFDTFDGINWHMKHQSKVDELEMNPDVYYSLGSTYGLKETKISGVDVKQQITANEDIGHIVPAAWQPTDLEIPANKISVDVNGVIRTPDGIKAGDKIGIQSHIPIYDLRTLRSEGVDPQTEKQLRETFATDLELPKDMAPEIQLLAQGIVGDGGGWFVRAERICKYLRSNYGYSVSEVAPPKDKKNLVNYFLLDSKSGDCSHFASAFVLMCRTIGVPARCVGGFSPGKKNIITGIIEVRPAQAHAWAEIYLPKYGWVPFDPVPGGYMPDTKPDEGILAYLGRSEVAQSIQQFVSGVAKNRLEAASKSATANEQTKQANGTATGAAGGQTSQGKDSGTTSNSSGPGTSASQVPNRGNNVNINGVSGRVRSLGGAEITPNEFQLTEKIHWIDVKWLKKNWLLLVLILALIPTTALAAFMFIRNLRLSKLGVTEEQVVRPSTQVFLRVVEDLSHVKFRRLPEDTPAEIVDKVHLLLVDNANNEWRAKLPILLEDFMDIYCSTRFAPQEGPQLRAELEEMGNKIHMLLTSEQKAS
jgi:transglutaminase-like putative cysteine protease